MRLTSHNASHVSVKCPWCRSACGPAPRRHANVTLYPELKERVLSLELFIRHCKACGRGFQIDGPFVYHDMRQRLWVEVERAGAEMAPDALAALESRWVMTPRPDCGYRIRVVDSAETLRETVLILALGFSDLAVQTVKRAALASLDPGALPGARFQSARINGARTLIVFSHPQRDGEPLAVEVDTGFFERFASVEKAYAEARPRIYVDNLTIGELGARFLDAMEKGGRGYAPRFAGGAGLFSRLNQAAKPVWVNGVQQAGVAA